MSSSNAPFGGITYRERGPKGWSATWVTVYLAGVGWMAVTSLPEDFWPWLAVSGLFLLVLVSLLAIPISSWVFHRIDLTPQTLRVGRERIPVSSVDPDSVLDALNAASVGTAPAGTAGGGTRRKPPAPADPRLVGGSWSVASGWSEVVIATREGEGLCIATRNPAAFLTALLEATRTR
ncbi:DUF3093 family protein [Streptomyces sodiiphilus]